MRALLTGLALVLAAPQDAPPPKAARSEGV